MFGGRTNHRATYGGSTIFEGGEKRVSAIVAQHSRGSTTSTGGHARKDPEHKMCTTLWRKQDFEFRNMPEPLEGRDFETRAGSIVNPQTKVKNDITI